jgi:hypothetical protein
LQKEGFTVFYRGVNRIFRENPHTPSLYYPPNRFWEHEDTIFKEVISVFPEEMRRQALTVEKLFVMRHYGFPTRILDISVNPLVDLFFACFADKGDEASLEKDGIVYTYAVPTDEIKFSDGDTVAFLANICKLSSTGKHSLNKKDNEDALAYLAYEVKQERNGFAAEYLSWDADGLNQVVCLRPRMNNPRIIRQQGFFFLFGIKDEKKNCAKMPDEWIKGSIIIPASSKETILRELASMGYDEGFFYPDYEHFNNVIRRRYGGKWR